MNHPVIKIHVKDFGTMTAELYPEMAPLTVANFLSLIEKKFFDGLIFHRVIRGFMLQGGGYTPDMEHKECDAIKGEFLMNGCRTNTLKHTRGVLSMARTNDPNSANSQFFICYEDTPYLDGEYATFGYVKEGMEVVDNFLSAGTDGQDRPNKEVRISSMKIIK